MSALSKPPVMVVVLDALRADVMDGNESGPMLALRELAHESYVFRRAYSSSLWTLPAHATLLTGLPPNSHMAEPPHMMLRRDAKTLPELFGNAGYDTACVSCNPWLSARYGITRGFRVVWQPPVRPLIWGLRLASDALARLSRRYDGILTQAVELSELATGVARSSPRTDNGARAALRFAEQLIWESNSPPFLLLNLMEAHDPYHGRGQYSSLKQRFEHRDIFARWERLRVAISSGKVEPSTALREDVKSIYWENVRYMDSRLGDFIGRLPWWFLDSGFLVVLSDHGQMLGEKGLLDHMSGLKEELIRVPLLIRPPGGTEAQEIEDLVDFQMLFEFLASIAMGRSPSVEGWIAEIEDRNAVVAFSGGNMVPYVWRIRGRDQQAAADLMAFRSRRDRPAVAYIDGRWKLICNLGHEDDELYNLGKDPNEKVNLMGKEPEVLSEMHEKLQERLSGSESCVKPPRDALPIRVKEAISEKVLAESLRAAKKPVLVWTGGKDSTLVLHLCKEVARRERVKMPHLMIVDHGQHFPETWAFLEQIAHRNGLKVVVARNDDVFAAAQDGKETVSIDRLDQENQEESSKVGFEGSRVPLSLNTPVGNHLLKTVALQRALREHKYDFVISGIRWDENPARSSEVFFSPREDPSHTRVHPILSWTETEVWDYTLENGLPTHPLYARGYRSFDGVKDSKPTDSRPAWEQDLHASEERAGRAQDKEHIMARLRALGYF